MHRKILMLEDDDACFELLRRYIRRIPGAGDMNLGIKRCSTSASAVTLLKSEDFDLILSDMDVLDSKGLDTVTVIRGASPDTPIVVVSSNVLSASDTKALLLMGVTESFRKDILIGEDFIKGNCLFRDIIVSMLNGG